jgi:TfoX/Sxy family transcriptional regulator of competence genes
MKFKKASAELETWLDDALGVLVTEPKQMFGCPTRFVNGQMFCGVFEDSIFVRLSETDRDAIMAQYDEVAPFDPMNGRPMREYVVLPESVFSDRSELYSWLKKGHAFVAGLPPKKAKGPKKG